MHPGTRKGHTSPHLLKTGSLPMPPNSVPGAVVFPKTPESVVQADIRPRKRGAEAQIWATLSLCTLMPPAASSISVLGLRTTWSRSPDSTVSRWAGSRLLVVKALRVSMRLYATLDSLARRV